ncbi:uncharacterized protein LOC126778554 [Nymphalis io]|uniref:uncharacterized protein LOC126778554 n=1 Tax=Inachis io TaxID=171585 RepID=UPI0021687A95|nr:uncharacterized protein LOC126778554 [Nymphalis io]XP_050358179.1 uncharacterized protein LOC126778554 [Nymphalis io]
MLPLLILFILTSAYAENCSYKYEGIKLSKRSILTIKGLPTNLVINPNNRDLFFTLIDIDTLQDDDVQTEMDQYVLRDGEPIKIDNINGQAAAVDVIKNKVYIASDDGLTVLNKSDKANFVAFKDEDITQLFKPVNSDKLYAVLFPESMVYKIDVKENEKTKIENVPCAFMLAVDAEENIFFECDSKYVKVLLKDFQEPIEFVGIPKNSARAITIDDKNRVILAANDGVYWLKSDSLIPKKLMNLDFIPSGIAFYGENLYLSTSGAIYEFSFTVCE